MKCDTEIFYYRNFKGHTMHDLSYKLYLQMTGYKCIGEYDAKEFANYIYNEVFYKENKIYTYSGFPNKTRIASPRKSLTTFLISPPLLEYFSVYYKQNKHVLHI